MSTVKSSALKGICASVLALGGLAAYNVHASDREYGVIGQWKLSAALDASEITSIDEKDAAQLVGKVFTITKEKVQLGSRVCPLPEFAAQRVEPYLYLRKEAHASAEDLGLPNPVTVVDLGCTIAFIKAKNRLVIHWDGWFFDARRQNK